MQLPNIIQSDIIRPGINTFWDEIPGLTKNSHHKPVLILCRVFQKGSAEEVQLEKMLTACRLTPEQYIIIQLEDDQKIAWHKLREGLKPSKILLLGIHPAQIGISALFGLNEINHFDERIFIPSLALKELEKQTNMRSQLWNSALKPVFIE
jgi:hypothetical protein